MTREEAITTLKEMHDSFDRIHENSDGEIGYEQMTALDVAIEALSADRPIADKCDDCLYEDSDKSLFPCTYCKRNHFEKYEKDESKSITESPNEVVEKNDEVIDHDREWIIGCIKHDGFIKTDRFDKANQIILDALSADAVQGEWEFVDNEIFAGEYFCSICGKRAEVDLYGEWILSNFCPSCGARTKGGDDE